MPGVRLNLRPVQLWLACAAIAAALASPAPARAQVVVVANGSPITELDIQQRTKLINAANHKNPSRQEVINELIDDRIKVAKAKTYGLEVTDAELENGFEGMARRQHLTSQQFTQLLERSGISPGALKARMKVELTWSQMIRGKYGSSLQIGEADNRQLRCGTERGRRKRRPVIFTRSIRSPWWPIAAKMKARSTLNAVRPRTCAAASPHAMRASPWCARYATSPCANR